MNSNDYLFKSVIDNIDRNFELKNVTYSAYFEPEKNIKIGKVSGYPTDIAVSL